MTVEVIGVDHIFVSVGDLSKDRVLLLPLVEWRATLEDAFVALTGGKAEERGRGEIMMHT